MILLLVKRNRHMLLLQSLYWSESSQTMSNNIEKMSFPILLGTIILPFVFIWIVLWKKYSLKVKLFSILYLLVLISAVNLSSHRLEQADQSLTSDASSKKFEQATADFLWSEYNANEIAANLKYANKRMKISGVVKEVIKDAFDNNIVVLKGVEYSAAMYAYFDDSHIPALSNLQKGQTIEIVCNIDELLLGTIMCRKSKLDN